MILMIGKSTLLRLETQLEVVPVLLSGTTREAVLFRPRSDKWSAHENLAHLARHHAVFLERLNRIVAEKVPKLDRYRAEDDSAWPEWSRLPTDEVLGRLTTLRAEVIGFINGLSEEETNRVGVHPLFGEMGISLWTEFFLLHEAHHLYVVMLRLGEAMSSLVGHPLR